jgi:hypothetical protein
MILKKRKDPKKTYKNIYIYIYIYVYIAKDCDPLQD